jgi:hypothetical protein
VPYKKGYARALASGEVSVPSLRYVSDRYVNPFGCGGGIACWAIPAGGVAAGRDL